LRGEGVIVAIKRKIVESGFLQNAQPLLYGKPGKTENMTEVFFKAILCHGSEPVTLFEKKFVFFGKETAKSLFDQFSFSVTQRKYLKLKESVTIQLDDLPVRDV